MKSTSHKIAFFGSSLVSAYWNGAATYYRGIIKALHKLGYCTTFFEPDAFERQQHRDLPDPDWAEVVVYEPTKEEVQKAINKSREYDIVVKASGVGIFDRLLEEEVLNNRQPGQHVIFWDVDAPATLASMNNDPESSLKKLIPDYDMVLTYGGGEPVKKAYKKLGARQCIPIYNALDIETHHPVSYDPKFACDLAFLGNRLPDREERVEDFFFSVADALPQKKFILGGNGWETKNMPQNINYIGHVYTKDHNAFNSSPLAVLNINRQSMAETGFSPATRVFEAAGAGACLISDNWKGLDLFLKPDQEVLAARNGNEVVDILEGLTVKRAETIGQAALKRMRAEHTYKHRAKKVARAFDALFSTSDVSVV